jgi:hypothetical protein
MMALLEADPRLEIRCVVVEPKLRRFQLPSHSTVMRKLDSR